MRVVHHLASSGSVLLLLLLLVVVVLKPWQASLNEAWKNGASSAACSRRFSHHILSSAMTLSQFNFPGTAKTRPRRQLEKKPKPRLPNKEIVLCSGLDFDEFFGRLSGYLMHGRHFRSDLVRI